MPGYFSPKDALFETIYETFRQWFGPDQDTDQFDTRTQDEVHGQIGAPLDGLLGKGWQESGSCRLA